MVDIVIVSYAKNEYCKGLTEKCLRSLFASENNSCEIFNVLVVESQEGVKWESPGKKIKTLKAPLPYGYHKFLNFARKQGDSEWVALCNNDLIFEEGWFTKIIKAHQKFPSCLSFSPICPKTQPKYGVLVGSPYRMGHRIRIEISGWCLVHKREIYEKIGDLDERFFHWFCDNDYAMTLSSLGLSHILVTDSIVTHHENQIGKTTENVVKNQEEMEKLTMGSQPIFTEKWKKHLL